MAVRAFVFVASGGAWRQAGPTGGATRVAHATPPAGEPEREVHEGCRSQPGTVPAACRPGGLMGCQCGASGKGGGLWYGWVEQRQLIQGRPPLCVINVLAQRIGGVRAV